MSIKDVPSSSSSPPSESCVTATFREHLNDSDPLSPPLDKNPAPTQQKARNSIDMINALAFWKSKGAPPNEAHEELLPLESPPAPISASARTVYILLTGMSPSTPAPSRQRLEKKSRHVRGKPARTSRDGGELKLASGEVMQDPKLSGAEVMTRTAEGKLEGLQDHTQDVNRTTKMVECRPVPKVPEKVMKKAKRQLFNPGAKVKARKIVIELKRMQVPAAEVDFTVAKACEGMSALPPVIAEYSSKVPSNHEMSHSQTTKAFALPPLSTVYASSSSSGNGHATETNLPYTLISLASPGGMGALGAQKSGIYDILGDVSGALIKKSHSQYELKAPKDRIGVFLWYWGFELTIPVAEISSLSSIHSIQSTFIALLYAMIIAGGAPELLPYVRYISNYLDMEWGAIKSQNKGNGVVIAATWLLPLALVPRPWDFAIAQPLTPPVASLSSCSETPKPEAEMLLAHQVSNNTGDPTSTPETCLDDQEVKKDGVSIEGEVQQGERIDEKAGEKD